MQMRATTKRLALAFLASLFAVTLVFGARDALRGSGDEAEAAPPFPVVRALAPDLYEFFIDGDGTATIPPGNISPASGLNVGEILAGDQSEPAAPRFEPPKAEQADEREEEHSAAAAE